MEVSGKNTENSTLLENVLSPTVIGLVRELPRWFVITGGRLERILQIGNVREHQIRAIRIDVSADQIDFLGDGCIGRTLDSRILVTFEECTVQSQKVNAVHYRRFHVLRGA